MTRSLADSRSHSARSLRMLLNNSTPWHEAAAEGSIETLKRLAAEAAAQETAPDTLAQHGRMSRLQQLQQLRRSSLASRASSTSSSIGANSDDSVNLSEHSAHSGTSDVAQLGSVCEEVVLAANAQTKSGKTPLMLACRGGFLDCVEFLLTCGATLDVHSKKRRKTCLHYAVEGCHALIAEKLLAAQQQLVQAGTVDAQVLQSSLLEALDANGHTPLHCAVAANCEGAVSLLLAHGANTKARAKASGMPCGVLVITDELPMHIAARVGNLNVVKMLLRAHVELEGDAPLTMPLPRNDPHMDPRIVRNCYWRTPYQVAIRAGATWLAEALHPSYPARLVLWGEEAPVSCAPHHIPRLAVIAASALQAKLEHDLSIVQAAEPRSLSRSSRSSRDGRRSRDGRGSPDMLGKQGVLKVAGWAAGTVGHSSSRGNSDDSSYSSSKSLSRLSKASSGPSAAAAAAAGGGSAAEVDDDCCGVCLENVPSAQVAPCMHRLCVECARGVCKSYAMSAPLCPFCRGHCAGFKR